VLSTNSGRDGAYSNWEAYVAALAVETFGRLALGAVLSAASIAKLKDHDWFRDWSRALRIERGVQIARWIPLVELSVGVSLLTGTGLLLASGLAVGLFLTFTILSLAVTRSGASFPCRCFGSIGSSVVGWHTVVRNVLLFIVALSTVVAIVVRPVEARVLFVWMPLDQVSLPAALAFVFLLLLVLIDALDRRTVRLLVGWSALRSPTKEGR